MFNKKLFNELKSEKIQILKLLLIKIIQMTTVVGITTHHGEFITTTKTIKTTKAIKTMDQ